jgi:hypothetical protein
MHFGEMIGGRPRLGAVGVLVQRRLSVILDYAFYLIYVLCSQTYKFIGSLLRVMTKK